MTTTRAGLNLVLTTFAALGLAAAGCDSSNSSGAGGSAGGAGAGGRGAPAGDTGHAGGISGEGAGGAAGSGTSAGGAGGGSVGGVAGAPGSGKLGLVSVSELNTSSGLPVPFGTTAMIVANALASYDNARSPASTCPSTISGACQLFTNCPPLSAPSTSVAAGTIRITGLQPSPVELYRTNAADVYESDSYASYLWTTSTPAIVTVGGSTSVPAYSMSVTAPNPIRVTAPVPVPPDPTGATYAIARGADLAVTWTGGVEGKVSVTLASGQAPDIVEITCRAEASAGSLTVPASLMASLGATGAFTVGVTSSANKTVDDWLMSFQASALGTWGMATFN